MNYYDQIGPFGVMRSNVIDPMPAYDIVMKRDGRITFSKAVAEIGAGHTGGEVALFNPKRREKHLKRVGLGQDIRGAYERATAPFRSDFKNMFGESAATSARAHGGVPNAEVGGRGATRGELDRVPNTSSPANTRELGGHGGRAAIEGPKAHSTGAAPSGAARPVSPIRPVSEAAPAGSLHPGVAPYTPRSSGQSGAFGSASGATPSGARPGAVHAFPTGAFGNAKQAASTAAHGGGGAKIGAGVAAGAAALAGAGALGAKLAGRGGSKSMLDTVRSNKALIGGTAAGGTALGAGGVYATKKRR